jgi:Spy/CpxP family protein refolding chaperone
MKVPVAAIAAAFLSWGVATAQTGPSLAPPPPVQSAPGGVAAAPAPAPDTTVDIWSHLTGDQRRQLWQQLTPEERATIWRRLPPEQREAIRERLTPEQRQSIRERWFGQGKAAEERRGGPAPGPKLSPEERRRLREEIRAHWPERATEMHRESRRGRVGR